VGECINRWDLRGTALRVGCELRVGSELRVGGMFEQVVQDGFRMGSGWGVKKKWGRRVGWM
jgi:hypothetical protein